MHESASQLAMNSDLQRTRSAQSRGRVVKWILAALHALIDAYGVEQIVIGLPLRLNGEIGIQAQKVKKFAAVLERTSNLPISFWDERFTTIEAGTDSAGNEKTP